MEASRAEVLNDLGCSECEHITRVNYHQTRASEANPSLTCSYQTTTWGATVDPSLSGSDSSRLPCHALGLLLRPSCRQTSTTYFGSPAGDPQPGSEMSELAWFAKSELPR